ncbi:hypothetical protein GCM10027436_82450 [Actinophytocola sediminis]
MAADEPSRWSYTPTRLRLFMVVGVVAAAAVLTVTSLSMSRAQDQVRTIGDSAAPRAATASDLYFALSDMDAQVARLVLIGNAETQAGNRIDALTTYGQRSRQIDADLEHLLTTTNTARDRQVVTALLNDLAVYRQWTWQAMAIVWQTPPGPTGPPPPTALGYYTQATNVVHHDLLPGAERLRDASQASLERAYAQQRTTGVWGTVAVIALGGALAIFLTGLQVWLRRRFRRRFNPALFTGTLLTIGLVVAAVSVLAVEENRLTTAHRDSFGPFLALSKAQAISYDAAADTSRYLLSERLPAYREDFGRKSACLLGDGSCPDGDRTDGGLASLAADEVADRWAGYRRTHDSVLALADSGRTIEAVDALTGISRGEAAFDFFYFDTAVSQLTEGHRQASAAAFRNAQGLLTGWTVVPIVPMGIVLLLIPVGVWPRLSEYR